MEKTAPRGRLTDTSSAWVVVFGSFLATFAQGCNASAMSVLLNPFLVYFDASQSMLGVLSAIRMFMFQGTGLVGGPMVQRFGPRLVAMAGILLCTAGTMMAAFTNTFLQVVITFCVLGGGGAGLLFIPSSVIVHQYHIRNRALAASVATNGVCLAFTVFPPALWASLDAFGLRGCLMILSAVTLQCLVGVVLFKPNPPLASVSSTGNHTEHNATQPQPSRDKQRHWLCSSLVVFKHGLFLLFSVSIYPMECGFSTFLYLCVQRAIDRGIAPVVASFMPTAFGIGAFTGQLLNGFLANRRHSNQILLYSLSLIFGGLVNSTSVLCSSVVGAHLSFAAAFGLASGMYMGLLSTVVVKLVGVDLLPTAMSATQFSRALAWFTTLPMTGWLVDVTGDYTASYLVGGALQVTSGLLVIIIVISKHRNDVRAKDVDES